VRWSESRTRAKQSKAMSSVREVIRSGGSSLAVMVVVDMVGTNRKVNCLKP